MTRRGQGPQKILMTYISQEGVMPHRRATGEAPGLQQGAGAESLGHRRHWGLSRQNRLEWVSVNNVSGLWAGGVVCSCVYLVLGDLWQLGVRVISSWQWGAGEV